MKHDKPGPVPCLVCGEPMGAYEDFEETHLNHPDGTEFTTSGHYGSTVVDGGDFIAVNVCNPCLEKARYQGRILIRIGQGGGRKGGRDEWAVWEPARIGGG